MCTEDGWILGFLDEILESVSEKGGSDKEYKGPYECRSKLDLFLSRERTWGGKGGGGGKRKDEDEERMSCPLCLQLTTESEYVKHCKRSSRHISYLRMEDLYLTYCDRRRINPVSCSIQELRFFIQRLCFAPDENLLPVWIYLASRHDADLMSLDVVGSVLESPLKKRRKERKSPSLASYACYSCPYFCGSSNELFHHIQTQEHASNFREWDSKGVLPAAQDFSNLFCDVCDVEFCSEESLRLHRFHRRHLSGGEFPPPSSKKNFCPLCNDDDDDGDNDGGIEDMSSHLSEKKHVERESMADGFLIFCSQNDYEAPLKISSQHLIRFLETIPPSNLLSYVKLLRRLFASDKISKCSFNDTSVKIFVSYTELSGSPYSPELSNQIIDSLTRCRFDEGLCPDLRFDRVSKLIYHCAGVHGASPIEVLKTLVFKNKNKKRIKCGDCPSKSFPSPLLYALHNDSHESQVDCVSCGVKYESPAVFYRKDECGDNCIKESIKSVVEQTLLTVLFTSDITPSQGDLDDYISEENKKKKRKRSCSDDSTEEEEGGLVGHWLINCPSVRARKISVPSRKKHDEEVDDIANFSIDSSKIVFNSSPRILSDDDERNEDKHDINGNIRKKRKMASYSNKVDKPLRKCFTGIQKPINTNDKSCRPPQKIAISRVRNTSTLKETEKRTFGIERRLTPTSKSSNILSPNTVKGSDATSRSYVSLNKNKIKTKPKPMKKDTNLPDKLNSTSNSKGKPSPTLSGFPKPLNGSKSMQYKPRNLVSKVKKPDSLLKTKSSEALKKSEFQKPGEDCVKTPELKNTFSDKDNQSPNVKPIVGEDKTEERLTPSLHRSGTFVKPLEQDSGKYFCLDCEGCLNALCDHQNHSRVLVDSSHKSMHTRLILNEDCEASLSISKTLIKDISDEYY